MPFNSYAFHASSSLVRVADNCSRFTDRIASFQGGYNIDLQYTPEALSAAAQVDPNGPDLFTAMREQLGLKLESKKMPLEGMVVDEIQPPTED